MNVRMASARVVLACSLATACAASPRMEPVAAPPHVSPSVCVLMSKAWTYRGALWTPGGTPLGELSMSLPASVAWPLVARPTFTLEGDAMSMKVTRDAIGVPMFAQRRIDLGDGIVLLPGAELRVTAGEAGALAVVLPDGLAATRPLLLTGHCDDVSLDPAAADPERDWNNDDGPVPMVGDDDEALPLRPKLAGEARVSLDPEMNVAAHVHERSGDQTRVTIVVGDVEVTAWVPSSSIDPARSGRTERTPVVSMPSPRGGPNEARYRCAIPRPVWIVDDAGKIEKIGTLRADVTFAALGENVGDVALLDRLLFGFYDMPWLHVDVAPCTRIQP